MKHLYLKIIAFTAIIFLLNACAKDPGEGGNSTITGKVYVKHYNTTFTTLLDEYYGPNIDVFIIYGDNKTYGDHVNTNYDGTYEFNYLRPGMYHIYVYSKDSTLQTTANIPVIADVEITKRKETVQVSDIIIFK